VLYSLDQPRTVSEIADRSDNCRNRRRQPPPLVLSPSPRPRRRRRGGPPQAAGALWPRSRHRRRAPRPRDARRGRRVSAPGVGRVPKAGG
jgi:hypothetical protein